MAAPANQDGFFGFDNKEAANGVMRAMQMNARVVWEGVILLLGGSTAASKACEGGADKRIDELPV